MINDSNLSSICIKCRKEYRAKHPGEKEFKVTCSGIPKQYIPDHIKNSLSPSELEVAEGLFDPVVWAKNEFGWTAYWYQETMLRCDSKRKVSRSGRRIGKTAALAVAILHFMAHNEGKTVLVVAPFKSHTEVLLKMIRELLRQSKTLKSTVARDVSSPYAEISLYNGSLVRFFTAGTKSGGGATVVRGQSADIIILDEADYLSGDDINAIMAIMITHPHVKVWASSTPTGKRENFFEWCHNSKWKEFFYPSQVLPHWNKELEQDAREIAKTELNYKHEYLAEFGEQEAGVYQHQYIEAAQLDYDYGETKRETGWVYCIGVDWNDTRIGTQIYVVGLNPADQKFYVVDAECVNKEGWTQLKACEKIIELNRKWRPAYIYVDQGFGTCVGPDTLLQIKNGVKKINDILPGEFVLTSSGKYKKVLQKVQTEPKESFLVKPTKCLPTIVSHCHPFLTLRTINRFDDRSFSEKDLKWRKTSEIDPKKDFLAIAKSRVENTNPIIDLLSFLNKKELVWNDYSVWCKSSNLSDKVKFTNRFLSIQGSCSSATIRRLKRKIKCGLINKLTEKESGIFQKLNNLFGKKWQETEVLKFNRFIDLTSKDLQTVLGWYISEGNANTGSVEICQKEQSKLKDFFLMTEAAARLFPSVKLEAKPNGTFRLFIIGKIVSELFIHLGGKLAQHKRIHPDLLSLEISHLVRGIILGDGHLTKRGGIQIAVASSSLIFQLRQYFINHDILPSTYFVPRRFREYQDQWRLDLAGTPEEMVRISALTGITLLNSQDRVSRREYIVLENFLLVPISEIKPIGIRSDLLDIEVEDDHSFCGNGVVLHNTQLEVLHKFGWDAFQDKMKGPGHPDERLKDIVVPYDFGSRVEILDLWTGCPIEKPAKPFLVENSVRRFETKMVRISKLDKLLEEQLRGYLVKVGVSGHPIYYPDNDTVGDHRLDALNLALVAFTLKLSDWGKRTAHEGIAISGKFGERYNQGPKLEEGGLQVKLPPGYEQQKQAELLQTRVPPVLANNSRTSGLKENRMVLTSGLPAHLNGDTPTLRSWTEPPGWSTDTEWKHRKTGKTNRMRNKPHRSNI